MLRITAILLLCFIVINLAMALFKLLRDRSGSTSTVKALTWRVALSLLLFVVIVIAAAFDIFPT